MKKPNLPGAIVFAGTLLLLLIAPGYHAEAALGDVDPSFAPGLPGTSIGPVQTIIVQPDGRVLMAGGGIARVNADGSRDSSFVLVQDPNRSIGTIPGMVLQPDGKVLVAHVGGIARLNSDGSQDPTFIRPLILDDNLSQTGLRAVAVQADGKILIGGDFRIINEQIRSSIARLNADGSLDESFIPATSGNQLSVVFSIAVQPNGKVIIGGRSMTVRNDSVARLNTDGSLDDANFFAVNLLELVRAVALQPDGKVVVGGHFNRGIVRLNSNGSLDAAFNTGPGADRGVLSVASQPDGKVLIGGDFTTINGTARDKLARLNADGTLDGTFDAGPGPHPVILSFNVRPDGKVFVGGADIENSNVSPYDLITRLHADGSRDGTFVTQGKGVDGYVLSHISVPDGKVLIGGSFHFVDATVRDGIAILNADGSLDNNFIPSPELRYPIVIVRQPNGKLLAGGYFSTDDFVGTVSGGIIRLNADGTKDDTFNPGTGAGVEGSIGVVHSIALQSDGKMLVGGQFQSFNGTACAGVVRLNADGSLDSTFDPDLLPYSNAIYAIAVQPDGKVLIGGDVNSVSGYYGLARLNPDGSLDSSFNHVTFFGSVRRMLLQPDGKVFINGNFFWVHGEQRPGFARLNANGSLDATFAPGGVYDPVEGSGIGVSAIGVFALQPNGKVLAGGIYYLGNEQYLQGLFRLHSDGSLDASFPATYHYLAQDVRSISCLPDGKLFVGGGKMTFNGVVRESAARLYGDSVPPVSFATWAASFGLAGGDAAANADPDKDGLPNCVEYILSGSPLESRVSGAFAPARPTVAVSGGNMLFTFLRDDASETADVTVKVENGINLIAWPNVFMVGANTAGSSPGVTVSENGTAPDTITVAIPIGTTKAMFARLRVTVAD